MKKTILFLLIGVMTLLMSSCKENYSKGERIGFLPKFSQKGVWWPSWEGELNLTQTGMNTSSTFQFSIDNDNENPELIETLKKAADSNWKIKVSYHEVWGLKNIFSNRGHTDDFVTKVEILDKTPMDIFGGGKTKDKNSTTNITSGKNDTIFVIVINPEDVKKYLKNK